jgi:hypothetical protein
MFSHLGKRDRITDKIESCALKNLLVVKHPHLPAKPYFEPTKNAGQPSA